MYGNCMCVTFWLILVSEKQSNECEYPVSGSVRFRPEQISAVTDRAWNIFGRTVGTLSPVHQMLMMQMNCMMIFNDCWQMLGWNCQICGNRNDHGKTFKLAYNMYGGTLNLAQSNPLWHSECRECTANVYCIVLCWCSWPTAGDLLDPAEICDLLKGIVLIVCCIVMHYIDVSMTYHIIRGQTVIKLYIFFNMLDVCMYIIITVIIIIDNNERLVKEQSKSLENI